MAAQTQRQEVELAHAPVLPVDPGANNGNVPQSTPDQAATTSAHTITLAPSLGAPPTISGGSSSAGPAAGLSPGSFVFYRNTGLDNSGDGTGSDGLTSDVGEDNPATNGRAVFQTGNWYASVSGDHGSTFGFVDPFSIFPTTGDYSGGFCCDQHAAHSNANDMVLWYLQYVQTGSGSNDIGPIRIAEATGAGNLLNSNWTYWNFSPESFGLGRGLWMDYPQMQTSSNYAYFTSNIFRTTDDSFDETVVWRIPLSQLAAGGTVNFTYWNLGGDFAVIPVNGASFDDVVRGSDRERLDPRLPSERVGYHPLVEQHQRAEPDLFQHPQLLHWGRLQLDQLRRLPGQDRLALGQYGRLHVGFLPVLGFEPAPALRAGRGDQHGKPDGSRPAQPLEQLRRLGLSGDRR